MKKIISLFLLLSSISAFAGQSAVCTITAKYPQIPLESKVVKIALSEPGYRDLIEGSARFSMNNKTIPGSLRISIWSGHAGQVTENALELGGFKIQNAGMNFSLKSDGSEISAKCRVR